jgi:hypothetical protein
MRREREQVRFVIVSALYRIGRGKQDEEGYL